MFQDADQERRHNLRTAIKMLEDVRRECQSSDPSFDPLDIARAHIDDAIDEISGEISRLTDEIGDEVGDDYAVESRMHQFRSAGL